MKLSFTEIMTYFGGIALAVIFPLWVKKIYERVSERISTKTKAILSAPEELQKALELQRTTIESLLRTYQETDSLLSGQIKTHQEKDDSNFESVNRKIGELMTAQQKLLERIDARMSDAVIDAKFEKRDIRLDNLGKDVDEMRERFLEEMKEGFTDLKQHIDRKNQ